MLDLAPHSRVWIFQANRFLKESEVTFVKNEMLPFVKQWASHGNELYGDFTVQNDLFLIVAVDEQRAPASGCSIDTLMRKIQEIGDELGVDFTDRLKVAYEDNATNIHLVTMGEFKQLMKKDEVTGQTTVYNNLIENVGDLNDKWRTKVADSWHKNLLEVL